MGTMNFVLRSVWMQVILSHVNKMPEKTALSVTTQQLRAHHAHQQVIETVEAVVATGKLFQRKCRAGAERLAPDRIVDQPHGLVREAEDHFMMADDPTEAQ